MMFVKGANIYCVLSPTFQTKNGNIENIQPPPPPPRARVRWRNEYIYILTHTHTQAEK